MRFKKLLMTWVAVSLASAAFAQQNETPKPKKFRVSQGVMEGNLTHKVNPKYPEEAKAARIQGDVVLQATIDREGNVSDLKTLSGHPLLAQASLTAVAQWKYKPLLLNGQPVEVETTIRVQFRM